MGVLVAEKWINSVIEVRKISERLMVLRVSVGERVLNLLTVYAPQVGRSSEEKAEFFITLGKELDKISTSEELIDCVRRFQRSCWN